jgi:hypothetical protein
MVISPTVSYAEEDTNGVHTHPDEENNESNPSSMEWGFTSQEERKG